MLLNKIKGFFTKEAAEKKEVAFKGTVDGYIQHLFNIMDRSFNNETSYLVVQIEFIRQAIEKTLPAQLIPLIKNVPLEVHSVTATGDAKTKIKLLGMTITVEGNEDVMMACLVSYWVDYNLKEIFGENPPDEMREEMIKCLEMVWPKPSFSKIADLYIQGFGGK